MTHMPTVEPKLPGTESPSNATSAANGSSASSPSPASPSIDVPTGGLSKSPALDGSDPNSSPIASNALRTGDSLAKNGSDVPAAIGSSKPAAISKNSSPGGRDATSIPMPAGVNVDRVYISYVISFIVFHALAMLVFVPWFFSWTGVAALIIGIYVFGAVGIPICYHRLLTHRSFRTPKWFERVLVIAALCNGQETPARWVAWHRLHHKESDHQEDPHSPLVNFLWSHFQWLVYENKGTDKFVLYQKYARDLLEDPFYMWLEKKTYAGVAIFVAHGLLIYLFSWIAAGLFYGFGMEAFQLATSIFIWGVVARVVWVWHITWSVNSLSHMFGYRTYDTDDHSRNNWFVALLTSGEGWHNNHHADQSSATVQHRWWEIDLNYYVIVVWSWMGLASHIVPPLHKRRAERGRTVEKIAN